MKKILMLLLATVLMNVGYVFGQIDTIVLNEVSYTQFSRGFYVNVDLFPYPTGYDHCGDRTKVVPVTNPITGDTWMDRNLGASQAATASDDENSFGDLFQWGRFADGHQCRSSGLHYPDSLATTAVPNAGNAWDGLFITTNSDIADWLSPQDDNLWQGVKGVNNPCPKGYRLPTETELNAERESWISYDHHGAFDSPLKLPVAGYRFQGDGSFLSIGNNGTYWSSTVSGIHSTILFIGQAGAIFGNTVRGSGRSVRCIKD